MLDFFKTFLSAIPEAAQSPLALIAYVVTIVAWVIVQLKVRRDRLFLEHLEKLPEKDRLEAFKAKMGDVPLKRGFTPKEYINLKNRRHRVWVFIAGGILILLALLISSSRIKSDPPILNSNQAIITVIPNQEAEIFSGNLFIKVERIAKGASSENAVVATVRSRGFPIMKIEDKSEGYTTDYNGNGTYEIRIMEVKDNFAKFKVEKKPR